MCIGNTLRFTSSCLGAMFLSGVVAASALAVEGDSHLYVGVGMGAEAYTPYRQVARISELPLNEPILSKFRDAGLGYVAGVFAGTWHDFSSDFSLGLEFGANLSSASVRGKVINWVGFDDRTAGMHLKHQADAYVALLPKYALTQETDVFFKVGYDLARFFVSPTHDTGGDLVSDQRLSKWRGAYLFGLGLQTQLTDQTSARITYDYTQHRSIRAQSTLASQFLSAEQIKTSVRPSVHRLTVGLVFTNPLGAFF